MRKGLLLFAVVLLFSSVDAFAHCKKCVWDPADCYDCADTDFNASVLCTVLNNGNSCYGQGSCVGPDGEECPHPPCPDIRWTSLQPAELKLDRDWQLVSVKVRHVSPASKKPAA